MDDEEAHRHPGEHTLTRWATRTAWVVLFITALVLTGSAYVLGTQSGLRWALSWVPNLQVSNLQGTVWSGFSADHIRWQGPNAEGALNTVEASQCRIQPNWRFVFSKHLVLNSVSANTVTVHIPPSNKPSPTVLPDAIHLPVRIDLNELRLGTLTVNGQPIGNIQAKAQAHTGQLQLTRLNFSVDDTQFDAQATLALQHPYATQGTLVAKRQEGPLRMHGELQVTGTLNRLVFDLNATGTDTRQQHAEQQAQLHAVLKPLNTVMLEEIRVQANRFNPKDWWASAPQARLNIQAQFAPNRDFTHIAGRFQIHNTHAQAWPAGGIPVTQLDLNADVTLKAQQPQHLQIQINELALGSGAHEAGRAQATLTWQAANTNAKQPFAKTLHQGALTVNASLQKIRPAVFPELPTALAIDGTLEGQKQGDNLEITQFELSDTRARIEGALTANLAQHMALDAQVKLSGLNPAAYVNKPTPWMQGHLNGSVQFKGTLNKPNGQLNVQLTDSTLAKAPFVLNAHLQGNADSVPNVNVNVDVLGNTLHAKGAYGVPGQTLALDVNLKRLADLGKLVQHKLEGTARINANLSGVGAGLSGQGDLDVNNLTVGGVLSAKSISGQFNVGATPDSTWTADLRAQGLGNADPRAADWLKNLNLTLRGTRKLHTLQVQADTGLTPFSQRRPFKSNATFSGGVSQLNRPGKPWGWRGELQALQLEGLWSPMRSLTLQEPAPLSVAAQWIELGRVALTGEDATQIQNRILRIAGADVHIEGEVPALAFPRLTPILQTQMSIEPKDLITQLTWHYKANAQTVDGQIDVSHVSGGLQVLEDYQLDVPIRDFNAKVRFNRQAANANVFLDAHDFGLLSAELHAPVEQNKDNKTWGLAADKPIKGSVGASFSKLNWLGPMISGGLRTQGSGQVAMALGGTLNKPSIQGRVFANDLDVFQLDQGVRLEQGHVVVDFTTDQATLNTFDFSVRHRAKPRKHQDELLALAQGDGKLTATGAWNLSGLHGALAVKLQNAPIVQRADRWVQASSTLNIEQPSVQGQAVKVRGHVDLLGGYIETPESSVSTLGNDVVVKGQADTSTASIALDVQLQANLGKHFFVNAEGLRTRLEGGVRLTLQDGVGGSGQRKAGRRLSANGTIQTVDGTYRAYGQDLTIDRGVVNFQGPLDNPGVNVRAVRKGVAVEAGVEVTGTAQRPKVTLVSEPAVPDSEKLSWMILGRGSNSADREQTFLLTAAAAMLGNDDDSKARKVSKKLGIDDIGFSTGSLTAVDSKAVGSKVALAPGADSSANSTGADDPLLSQRIVTLGKRLNDKLVASFDQSMTTAASVFKLSYQYSRQLSIIARTGADNALDALYQISFD